MDIRPSFLNVRPRNNKILLDFISCFLLLLTSMLPRTAHTQQLPAQSSSPLEVIVVTARKQSENIQDVPASIITLSGSQLEQAEVNDLNDLVRQVPGLNTATNEPNHLNLSIRGITSASETPTVGMYIDDIPIDTQTHDLTGQYEPPILDLARVEVLEGPQGTLYGGSAMGGAVKFISQKPDLDALQLDARGEAATTESGGIGNIEALTTNIPVIEDRLALRVSVSHDEIAGYIDRVAAAQGVSPTVPGRTTFTSLNTVNESDINQYTIDSAKVSMTWLPGAGVEVTSHLMFQQTKTPDVSEIWPNLPRYESSFAIAQPDNDTFELASITVTKSFSFADFSSITGFVRTRDATTRDDSAALAALDPALASLPDQPSFEGSTNRSYTQELRLAHNDKLSPFGYVGGAYYRNLEIDRFQTVYAFGSGATSQTLPNDAVYGDSTLQRIREKALFGEGYFRYGIFEFTLGGRAYGINTDINVNADGIFNGGQTSNRELTSQSGISKKAVISATLSADHLLYALASQGFRIGGPVVLPANICAADLAKLGLSAPPNSYGSDSLWNYELGSKNSFASGAVVLNASVFYMDWSLLQQSVYLPTCGFGFTGNVGAAVSKGAELQLSYRPTSQLTLMAGAIYDNAEITRAAAFIPAQVGDPIELSPKWVENLSAEYGFPLAPNVSGEIYADYQNHGSQTQSFNRTIETDVNPISGAPLGATETVPDPSYLQAAYHFADFSAGVKAKSWSTRLILQNAFNNHPALSFTSAYGYPNTEYTLTPRTLRLAVTFHY
jgi:iron complex outermembrane recepter protein